MLDFYKNVISDKIHEKLTEAIVAMMATGNLPYYGEFALFINFFEAKNNPYIKTAGVNVTSSGMNFYWSRKFIDSLAQPQVNFLLIHEEFHILFDHIKRSVGYNQSSANIVQDMIINQVILDEIMKKQGLGGGPDPFIEIPKDMFKKNSALFIPKEYKGEAIFEDLYEWYVAKKREWQEKNKEAVSKMRKESNKCEKCGAPMERKDTDQDDQDDGENEGDKNESNKKGQAKKPGDKGQEKGDQGKGKGKEDSDEDGEGDGDENEGKGKQPGDKGNKGGNQPGDGGDQSDGQGGQGSDSDGDEDDDGEGQGQKCPNCGHEHNNNKSRQGKKDTSGNDRYGKYGKNDAEMYSLETIFEGEEREEQNTLDTHLSDDIPQELKREIVESVMTRLKNRGLTSGDVEAIINKLRKTKKDYLREIKRAMSNHVFGSKKEKTIVRPNRRGISGLKGHKKYKNEINVLLDTSGSMGGEFEKVLSYIFQNDIQMNLIQCDARVQKVLKVKDKKQLEKMKIHGLGGTSLMPGIDFMTDKKNKIYMYNTVILTDGWTDSLDFKNVKTKTLILSTACKCPVSYDNGRVKQIENIGKQD